MSNAVRYDPLLVRALARELDAALSGTVLRAVRADPRERRAALELEGAALLLELHPLRGWIRTGAVPPDPIAVQLPGRTRVRGVAAPPDERLLRFELAGRGGPDTVRTLVVELLGNQLDLLALDADGRIRWALWPRRTGRRALTPTHRYVPPEPRPRAGVDRPVDVEAWLELLGDVAPAEREARLTAAVAWLSPLNAGPILGAAADGPGEDALRAAHERYLRVAWAEAAAPVLLRPAAAPQPYPIPLPGVESAPAAGLLEAMGRVAAPAAEPGPPPPQTDVPPELLLRLDRRAERLRKRRRRLEEELRGSADRAERLRRHADLLLSQAHAVPRGREQAEISDFEGGTIALRLDPALDAVQNAQAMYERARKRERAAERVPALLDEVDERLASLVALREAAAAGTVSAERLAERLGPARRREAAGEEEVLPYRVYRTSGGLEARVGRSGRANDELTFHHSAPDDVWLHARDVAGAHVILRWGRGDANPPARDLAEAAVLAALGSRARTSGTVAVDWTRRKYVRKPRKSPPGLVVPDRVKTLFVEPDEAVEKRLRVD